MISSIFYFDTSIIPDDATITSATFSVYGRSKSNSFSGTTFLGLVLVGANHASNKEIVAGDYDSLDAVALSDLAVQYDDFSITAYNNFILNTAGIAAISKTGVT